MIPTKGRRTEVNRSLMLIATGLLLTIFAAGLAGSTPVTVEMIEFVRPAEAAWQNAMIKRFHAAQDAVRVELVATAGVHENEKMLTLLAAGVPLDIGYQDPYQIIEWTHQGIVKRLSRTLWKMTV